MEQLDAEKNCEESGGGGTFFSCLFACVEMLYLFVFERKKLFWTTAGKELTEQ